MECDGKTTVSVVTLTYKNFSRLFKTIASVLMQDYPYFEYIISDDGSPEFPEHEIIAFIEENRPKSIEYRIIHHECNVGTVCNLNQAYSTSKGKVIIPLSCGDEFYSTNTVSEIVNRFSIKGSQIICGARCLIDENGLEKRKMPYEFCMKKISKLNTPDNQHKAFVLREFYEAASGSATYMKRELWEEMGHFDEIYRLWEDGPFFEKITSHGVCIDFAMELITIRYLIGGVSTGNVVNPLLKRDLSIFNRYLIDKIDKLELSRFEERKLRYFIDKCEKGKRINLKYIDVIMWKLINHLYLKIASIFETRCN